MHFITSNLTKKATFTDKSHSHNNQIQTPLVVSEQVYLLNFKTPDVVEHHHDEYAAVNDLSHVGGDGTRHVAEEQTSDVVAL